MTYTEWLEFIGTVKWPLTILLVVLAYKVADWRDQRRAWRAQRKWERGANQCNVCKQPYRGLALDCRCTNYGR